MRECEALRAVAAADRFFDAPQTFGFPFGCLGEQCCAINVAVRKTFSKASNARPDVYFRLVLCSSAVNLVVAWFGHTLTSPSCIVLALERFVEMKISSQTHMPDAHDPLEAKMEFHRGSASRPDHMLLPSGPEVVC